MKRISSAKSRCSFCQTTLGVEQGVCQHCSATLAVPRDQAGSSTERPDMAATEKGTVSPTDLYWQAAKGPEAGYDDEATEQVAAYPANLYRSAIGEQQTDEDDATERAAAYPVSLYLGALAAPAASQTDAIERVVLQSDNADGATLAVDCPADADVTARVTIRALEADATQRVVARSIDDNGTERVVARSVSLLYARAVKRAGASSASTPAPKPTTSAQPAPAQAKKRSRRSFLAALHLVADILLLLVLLFTGLVAYQQNARAQQTTRIQHQVQQQSNEYKASLERLQSEQQTAQLKQQAQTLVQQFHQEVQNWGNAHLYHDKFDRHTYALDSGYMQPGIGALIDKDFTEAQTAVDFSRVVGETQYARFNLQMLEADYADHTPYNQPHASDLSMFTHYHLQQKTVMVVSLVEQVMRVYQQGKLMRAFPITSGRLERPSLPGVWTTLDRRSPTIFVAGDPPGSPYWFPATPINYAILYHLGGFFVHDAPWRGTFGPGSQFPHQDASGNTAYNFDGSHGCINLSEADAAWVYHNTDWNSVIVIY